MLKVNQKTIHKVLAKNKFHPYKLKMIFQLFRWWPQPKKPRIMLSIMPNPTNQQHKMWGTGEIPSPHVFYKKLNVWSDILKIT